MTSKTWFCRKNKWWFRKKLDFK